MSTIEIKTPKIERNSIINMINEYSQPTEANLKENFQIIDKNENSIPTHTFINNTPKGQIDILNSSNGIKNGFDVNGIENNIKLKNAYSPENININMNINEEINQNEKVKSSNHDIINSCVNNCINWTLKAHINKKNNTNNNNQKEFKSNYIFKGKNIFFTKLDFSVLNAFNNSLCFDRCFPKNKIHFDNKKKIIEKLKQESFRQLKEIDLNKNDSNNECDNASLKNILENNYPIDNNKNNFNIIDNNLCLKENLNNVFLLKFDLKNNIDKNNDFRLINDNCVEREIEFILNGEIHGNKIFTNDLQFSVTYRDFIKTIQFRLDNFKNKILDYNYNRKYGENNNRNHNNLIQEKNQKIFYGKMINNINIGIEFLKPQSFDKLQTNFNSIVNAEIELTKIFIELTIPNHFINKNKININNNNINNNNININLNNNKSINNEKNELNNKNEIKKQEILTKKKEEEKNKNINVNIKEPKLYVPPPPLIPSYIPPPPPPPASWANLNFFNMRLDNNGIPLPPPFPLFNNLYKKNYNNNYSSLRNQLMYNNKFPNVTFDYLSINNNDHKSPSLSVDPVNIYSSPGSGNFSPMSASYLMMQPMHYYGGVMRPQSMSMNSPFNSNYSSPYIKENNNINSNSRKYSDTFNNNELFDNLMQTNNNNIFNRNQKTPSIHNKKGDENISLLNLQQYMSPSIEKQQNSLNETDISSNGNHHNNNHRKMPPITIKQRILESNNKNNKDKKDRNKDNMDNIQNNKNIFRELRDSFVLANQGKTNFEIFLESVSPLYNKNVDISFLKLKLIDIFNKFKKVSLFGLKNIYCFNGELIHLSYILSLSSLSIKIINKSLIDEIVLELKKTHPILEKYDQLNNGEELTININQYIIYISPEYIQISFTENLPYQLRNPFIKTITDLSKYFPYFNKITIEDINLIDSLFSILYSPLKCSKPYINYTSFVVYYQFTKEIIQEEKMNKSNMEYDKQTITGVLPIKINSNLYFQRIIIFNFIMNVSPLFNYFSPYFNDDTIMIKNLAYAVINDVSKHIRGTSYDYECFMKLSKHNWINQLK